MDNLNNVIQEMDVETLNKCKISKEKALEVEDALNFSDHLLSNICSVHDVGRMMISSHILNKPGILSPAQADAVAYHPYWGYRILDENGIDDIIKNVVLYHHGQNPPVQHNFVFPEYTKEVERLSKMVFSIDYYTALISERPYRPAFSKEQTYQLMIQNPNAFSEEILNFIRKYDMN